MFSNRNTVCAIELGTSKISVLTGVMDDAECVTPTGYASAPAAGCVVKGEITDMKKAAKILNGVLDDVDRRSNGDLSNCRLVTVLVTGCGIDAKLSQGSATVKNRDFLITEDEIAEAGDNAKAIHIAGDREIINCSISHYCVDRRPVRNPLNQSARVLDAFVHIVHGKRQGIANFTNLINNAGLENARIEPVFSALASGIGVLTSSERENGSLLIDMGAGTTEYLVYVDDGIRVSGVLQVGMEHVVNDLSIGLELTPEQCRTLLESGALNRYCEEGGEFIEIKVSVNRTRKIPVSSFEEIVNARIREIFEVVRSELQHNKMALNLLSAGGIITGGGALYTRSRDIFAQVFDCNCRMAVPVNLNGFTGISAGPQHSAVWGALKTAEFFYSQLELEPPSVMQSLMDKVYGVFKNRN